MAMAMSDEGSERDDESEKREIGKLAVWSVSSAKPGNGVDLLRDSNLETYWQSDGAQPHLVNIQFQKKVRLQQLAIYVDYKHDESYTPNKISVRAGNSFHDLREIKQVELIEPVGWVRVSLCPNDSIEILRAFLVQLAVLSNHQNGRDTHIRQIKIYGPRQNCVTKTQGKWTSNGANYSQVHNMDHNKRSLDEDLSLFHEMRRHENKNFLHPSNDDIDILTQTKYGGLTGFPSYPSPTPSWVKGNDLLATDAGKNDYNWLLTPPETPLFPSLDKEICSENAEPILTCITQPSKVPRLCMKDIQNKTRPPTPLSTRSTCTQRSQTSSSTRQGVTTPSNPSREASSPNLISAKASTPKTLSRSSTSMNRASLDKLSPHVLRRVNTSPNARSSSTKKTHVVSTHPNKVVSGLRGPIPHPWHSPDFGFYNVEPPPNLRTSFSDRTISNSRGSTVNPRSATPRHSSGSSVYPSAISTNQDYWRAIDSCMILPSKDGRNNIVSGNPHFHGINMGLGPFDSTRHAQPISRLSFDNHESNNVYHPTIKPHKKSSSFAETSSHFLNASVKKSHMEMPSTGSHHYCQQHISQRLSACPVSSTMEDEQRIYTHFSPRPNINVNKTSMMSFEHMDKMGIAHNNKFDLDRVKVDSSLTELMEKNTNDFTLIHHQAPNNVSNDRNQCRMQKYHSTSSQNHQLEIKDEDFIDIQEDTSMKAGINHGKKLNTNYGGIMYRSNISHNNVTNGGLELSGNGIPSSQKISKLPTLVKNRNTKEDVVVSQIPPSPVEIFNVVNEPKLEISSIFHQPKPVPNSSMSLADGADNMGLTMNTLPSEGQNRNNNSKDNNIMWANSAISNISFKDTSDKLHLCTSIVHELVYSAVKKGEEKAGKGKGKDISFTIPPLELRQCFSSRSFKGRILKKIVVKPRKETSSMIAHKYQREDSLGGGMEKNIFPLTTSRDDEQQRFTNNPSCGCNIM